MSDRIEKIFQEMAKEAINPERITIGEYQIEKMLYEEWLDVVQMDLNDYISIHQPKNSEDLEWQMNEMIQGTLKGNYGHE